MRMPSGYTLPKLLMIASAAILSSNANAVPSFARQTGMACAACHTTFPELTQFGRNFKLHGYTLTGLQQIESKQQGTQSGVKINEVPPLSMMLTTSLTHTSKSVPGQQNDDFNLPQELSLFFAGEISPHMGSFLQATYTQADDKFSIDNTDIRYANEAGDTVYGVTLNNSPTVEDLWNSTSVWGYPFLSSEGAPAPSASPLINDGLAQDVAGIGGYALWNNHLYGDLTLYRSAHIGGTTADSNTIKGVTPYWRLAWQQNLASDYLELGTFGLQSDLYPGGNVSGKTDKYTDIGVDGQYEHPMGSNMLTVRASYVHEKQKLDAAFANGDSANASDKLEKHDLNGTYHFGTTASLSADIFNIKGTSDSGLYAPDPVEGSANGSPNSRGWTLGGTYSPWQNTQFSLAYTGYTKFNGNDSNYDGSGRSASDNDTLYLSGWFVW